MKHGKKRETAVEKDFPGKYPGLQLLLNVVQERPVRFEEGADPRGARPNPR